MRVNLLAATRRVLLTAGLSGAAVAAQAYDACGPCQPCQPAYIDCPPAMSFDTPPAPTPSGEASAAPTPGQSDSVQPLAPDAAVDLSPTAPPVSSVASRGRASANFAPNMIGDTSAGGCGGLRVNGQVAATLNHPIYACSRLNIAENNSAQVRDRAYVTYRHFHNSSGFDFFSDDPANGGLARDFDINQFTLAIEKRLGCYSSVEVRLPINSQLNSDLDFIQDPGGAPSPDGRDNNLALIGTDTDIGNISVIFKQVLLEDCCRTVSWGLGVNTPTAPDLSISGRFVDTIGGGAVDFVFDGVYRNDTVNLQPFLAFQTKPQEGWFTQGFLQVDVPVNDSPGSVTLVNRLPAVDEVTTGSAGVPMQTLLRANLGIGKWLTPHRCGQRARHAVVLEAHYTGTLESADRLTLDGVNVGPGTIDLLVGPLAENSNVVNLVGGIVSQVGKTSIYNGFGTPLRDGTDRGFDFEYSLTVNRNF